MLLNVVSPFNLKTGGQQNPKDEKIMRNGCEMALIYELEGDVFKDIAKDYPDFANSIQSRGEIRTALFKQKSQLSEAQFCYKMKVVDVENRITKNCPENSDAEVSSEAKFEVVIEITRHIICAKMLDLKKNLKKLFGKRFTGDVVDAILCRVVIMNEGTREIDPLVFEDQVLLLKQTRGFQNINLSRTTEKSDAAFLNYYLRRQRRLFLKLRNIAAAQAIISRRWWKFAENLQLVVKNEVSIQEDNNSCLSGLHQRDLLEIA